MRSKLLLYSRKSKRLYMWENLAPSILAIGKIHLKKGTIKKIQVF